MYLPCKLVTPPRFTYDFGLADGGLFVRKTAAAAMVDGRPVNMNTLQQSIGPVFDYHPPATQ